MTSVIGNKVDYIIERKNKDTETVQQVILAAYNGTFSVTDDFEAATKFTDVTKAMKNADMQNLIAELNELPYEFYVVERSVQFKAVSE